MAKFSFGIEGRFALPETRKCWWQKKHEKDSLAHQTFPFKLY